MKKIALSFAALALFASSSFAADLRTCKNQYLVSAGTDAQAKVHQALYNASMQDFLSITSYNPKVGPFAIYGVAANTFEPANILKTYQLMLQLQQIPGTIIECNSGLSLQ